MPIKQDTLEKLFSISLKARILREWQKASRIQDQEFSERELLTLEVIENLKPITEKALCKIFGLSFSSVAELTKKLSDAGLIDSGAKARGKALALSGKGTKTLEDLKKISASRFEYLFESFSETEWEQLLKLFGKVEKNVENHVQRLVFDRSPI
ncbi:MAG TPA: MarR family winged helix-turn-helix transcriptional regulator [Candidatus Paceibacterota bacterium]|nr:MarR family winged helix-turn-helix transcriptional regulator [Candidatus Paceibacterota bacterium]